MNIDAQLKKTENNIMNKKFFKNDNQLKLIIIPLKYNIL